MFKSGQKAHIRSPFQEKQKQTMLFSQQMVFTQIIDGKRGLGWDAFPEPIGSP